MSAGAGEPRGLQAAPASAAATINHESHSHAATTGERKTSSDKQDVTVASFLSSCSQRSSPDCAHRVSPALRSPSCSLCSCARASASPLIPCVSHTDYERLYVSSGTKIIQKELEVCEMEFPHWFPGAKHEAGFCPSGSVIRKT